MNFIKAHNIACPIDGERLELHGKTFLCENRHAFDLARQGYVNLLPVQHKRSKQPGDSKEMVVARTQFLNAGVYEPVASKMSEIILAQLTESGAINNQQACVMDAGCGEGYYLEYVFDYLKDKEGRSELSFIGLDISKPAIVESAKRNKQISWIVGTNRQPPVEDESVDVLLCVFGFHSFQGFNKILKAGGRLVLVEPGADHLKELREVIYKDVKISDPADIPQLENTGFSVINVESLQFKTQTINNEQINNLLLMTPHFFRADKEGREKAVNLESLSLTVDVVFRTLEKCC